MSDRDQMLFVGLTLPVVLALLVWAWVALVPACETEPHRQLTQYGHIEINRCV